MPGNKQVTFQKLANTSVLGSFQTVSRATALLVLGLVLFCCSLARVQAAALLHYYDDGTGSPLVFGGTELVGGGVRFFGNALTGVQFKDDPILQASSEFVPPHSTNTNQSYVFQKDDTTGKVGGGLNVVLNLKGGGVPIPPNPPPNPPNKGAVVVTYGTAANIKTKPASQWTMNFFFRQNGFAAGGNPDQKWVDLVLKEKAGLITLKNLKYIGDPIVAPPPTDTVPGTLGGDPNEMVIFFNVEDGVLDFLDLLIGDFMNPLEYVALNHHVSEIQVLGGVGPDDFGLDPSAVTVLNLMRAGNLNADGRFGVQMAFSMLDPELIPEPAPLALVGLGFVLMIVVTRRRSQE